MLDAWLVVLLAVAVVCAVQAIRATQLLASAIWLAGVSAVVSVVLYALGAQAVAVIELSVGAGLVTVLFVFAISIAGEDAMQLKGFIPAPLAVGLVVVAGALLAWMTLPALGITPPLAESTFADMLWQTRGLDVLVQIVLIFAGVIGVLGLLGDAQPVPNAAPSRPELVDDADTLKELQA